LPSEIPEYRHEHEGDDHPKNDVLCQVVQYFTLTRLKPSLTIRPHYIP
jgi:hypothetical protein